MKETNIPSQGMLLLMPWIILFLFLHSANDNIIQLIAPAMSEYYGVSKVQISLIVSIGGFISGIGATVYSILTEKFSMRQLYLFGLITFGTGTLFNFLIYPWFPLLVISRTVQSIGSVCAVGCYVVLVMRYLPVKTQSMYLAMSSAMFQLSLGIGVLLGAWITNYLNWKFALLLPIIGLIALPSYLKYMPKEKRGNNKLDTVGAIMLTLGMMLIVLTITLQNYYLLALSVFILFIYYGYEKKHKNPFLDMKILRIKGLKMLLLTTFLLIGIQSGLLFMLPFIVNEVYKLSLLQIGLLFFTASSPAIIVAIMTKRVVNRFGINKTFYLGWAFFFMSVFIYATSIGGSIYMIWLAMLTFTISGPLFYTAIVLTTTSLVPKEKLGSGMGILFLMMGCGNSIFVAAIGLILTNLSVDFQLLPFIRNINEGNNYSNVYVILAILLCVSLLLFRRIRGNG